MRLRGPGTGTLYPAMPPHMATGRKGPAHRGRLPTGVLACCQSRRETFWSGVSEVVAGITAAVVESVVNLELASQVSQLVVRTRARDDSAVVHLCELAGSTSHRACASGDEYSFPVFQFRNGEQAHPCCKAGNAQYAEIG